MKSLVILPLVLAGALSAQKTRFHEIPEQEINTLAYLKGGQSTGGDSMVSIPSFEVSGFISLREYKRFVEAERAKRGEQYALMLLPHKSAFAGDEQYNKYWTQSRFEEDPVIGVSWRNAVRYCAWRTHQENPEGLGYFYRMPTLGEWLSARQHMTENKIQTDFDEKFADWLLDSKDESIYSPGSQLAYTYFADPKDPPSMKRKLVIGRSFLYGQRKLIDYSNFSYYQDSGYRHISFRMVKSDPRPEDPSLRRRHEGYLSYAGIVGQEPRLPIASEKIESENYSAAYNTRRGRFHGYYKSTYTNGQVKAEGYYSNNQRVGEWNMWDESGSLILTRQYHNNFNYQQLYPKYDNATIELMSKLPHKPAREKDNEPYQYFHLEERAYILGKRHWTKVEPKHNDALFRGQALSKVLITLATEGKVMTYDTTSDQFRDTLGKAAFLKRYAPGLEVGGYLIKEDWFFDNDRMLSETRILGICPLVSRPPDTIVRPLAWFYYPALREELAKQSVSRHSTGNPEVRNLDDVFFFRCYDWTVYKESNISGKELPMTENPIQWEIELIEQEHDMWLKMYAK